MQVAIVERNVIVGVRHTLHEQSHDNTLSQETTSSMPQRRLQRETGTGGVSWAPSSARNTPGCLNGTSHARLMSTTA